MGAFCRIWRNTTMGRHKVRLFHAPTGMYIDELFDGQFPKKATYIKRLLNTLFTEDINTIFNGSSYGRHMTGKNKVAFGFINNIIFYTCSEQFLLDSGVDRRFDNSIRYYHLDRKDIEAYRARHCIEEFVLENIK